MGKGIRNNKGMTLMEIVVAMALASTLFVTVAQMLTQSGNLFWQADRQNRYEMAGDAICDDLEKYLWDLEGVTALSVGYPPDAYGSTLAVQDGRLYLNGVDLFGEDFYGAGQLSVTVRNYDQALDFKVYLKDASGNLLYQQEVPVGKNPMEKLGIPITATTEGKTYENLTIYKVYE